MAKDRVNRLIESIRKSGREILSKTAVEIHCYGNTYVTGCKKITVYTKEKIEMICSDSKVTVHGSSLELDNLINGQIAVRGKVKAVNFDYDK